MGAKKKKKRRSHSLAVLWECADSSMRALCQETFCGRQGEKPSAVTRGWGVVVVEGGGAFLFFKRRGDPGDPPS